MAYISYLSSWILASKELTCNEKLLCALIDGLSKQKGYCFASNETLAQALGTTEGAIKKALSRLEIKKIISMPYEGLKTPTNRQIFLHLEKNIENNDIEIGKAVEKNTNSAIVAFDNFYKLYPRKEKRELAHKIFKYKKLHKRIDELILATKNYTKKVADIDHKFIMLPATFLDNKIWEEYIVSVEGSEKISNVSAVPIDTFENFRIKSVNMSHALFHSGKMNKIDELEMQWSAGAGREGFTEREVMVISDIGFARFITGINDGDFIEREIIPVWKSTE